MKSLGRAVLGSVWLWGAVAVAQTSGSSLESATGPSVGISAGGYTGGALGSTNFFQSTPPSPQAGAAATGSAAQGTSLGAASSAAVPSFGSSTGATSTSAATGRAATVAPAGVSAVGESLSGAGTAVVPSTITTPSTSPGGQTTAAPAAGSAGSAPASTQPYPNLFE